jgi:hypothetical protein
MKNILTGKGMCVFFKTKTMNEKMIIDAYCRIRTIDQTIPDDVLDFMKNAAIDKLRSEQLLCYLCKKNKVEVEDDLCDDCSRIKESCVVVREDCPDGYWYSNLKGKQFNIKTCHYSDLREVEGFSNKEPNECWKVADGEFAGNLMAKQHCL